MTLKNLVITGLTVMGVLFLTAVFFLGFDIWRSPEGIGLLLAITVMAFLGAAVGLRRQNAIPLGTGNGVATMLPGWVRTWQRSGFLLFVLLLLTFYFIK